MIRPGGREGHHSPVKRGRFRMPLGLAAGVAVAGWARFAGVRTANVPAILAFAGLAGDAAVFINHLVRGGQHGGQGQDKESEGGLECFHIDEFGTPRAKSQIASWSSLRFFDRPGLTESR